MRLFSWMQNKFNGKQGNKRAETAPATYHKQGQTRGEFSNWPHGLLAIGTFGNSELIERPESENIQENPSSSEDVQDFTPEEIGKLQKELIKLLSKKHKSNGEKEIAELPLDRFLNCPSILEVDRRISSALCSESDEKEEDIDRTISVILGRCKEIYADKSKKAIGKKSLSFLLKKMVACRGGFAPAPSLRDTLQDSRMEKLLRIILHEKIYPQNASSQTSSTKRFIEDRQKTKKKTEDEKKERRDDGHRWVKTDSEYIVLEI